MSHFFDKTDSPYIIAGPCSIESRQQLEALLAAIAEVPLKEISRKYGKSESWARVTYYRARQMLTERIGAK